MKRVRLTGPALDDIERVLRRSAESFGAQARDRYRNLFDDALQDLSENPTRPGVRAIDDIRAGYMIYHLRSSKGRGATVHRPRHLLAFYIDESGDVIVARVFHERQMLDRYLSV